MKGAEEQESCAQTGTTETWAPVSTKKTHPDPEFWIARRQESVGKGGLKAATNGSPPGCFPAMHKVLDNYKQKHQSAGENNKGQHHVTSLAL